MPAVLFGGPLRGLGDFVGPLAQQVPEDVPEVLLGGGVGLAVIAQHNQEGEVPQLVFLEELL